MGSGWWALGAAGNLPCCTCESIDEVSFCLETPKVSSANSATAAAVTNPGRSNRRISAGGNGGGAAVTPPGADVRPFRDGRPERGMVAADKRGYRCWGTPRHRRHG